MDRLAGLMRPFTSVDPVLLQTWTGVLENVPDAVFIVAGVASGGQILYLNSAATRMFGYERRELLGQSIDMLVPEAARDHHTLHRDTFARAPKLRAMDAELRLRGRRRDGTEFPIDVMLNPYDHGAVPATIAIVRDMTERKRLEEALLQARDSAVRANEVKSRFLAAASHDLRQPLQTIWSMQSVLARALKDTAYAPHIAMLEEAVRNMDQMLSSLVDINRLEKGAIQPVIRDFPLQEIFPHLRSEFAYAASAKSLSLDIADSGEFARSDPTLLPVILRNLLGNAIKYTQRGSIELRVVRKTPACSSTSSIRDPVSRRNTYSGSSMHFIKWTIRLMINAKAWGSDCRSCRSFADSSITRSPWNRAWVKARCFPWSCRAVR